jgi:NAD-dependent dihydropyrimidine dehydrogenase PreA subunit
VFPRIQTDCCDQCGICIEICPSEVYQMREGGVEVTCPEECIECGACVRECPVQCVVLIDA